MTNWYANSYNQAKRIYGDDANLFCGLLAATSARMTVKANATIARKAYNQIKATGTLNRDGYIKCHYTSVLKFLHTGALDGHKVGAFYECLTNPESQRLPVDMWMMRAYGYTHDVPTRKEYDYIETDMLVMAQLIGMKPRDYQSYLWERVRGDNGSFAECNSLLQGRLL